MPGADIMLEVRNLRKIYPNTSAGLSGGLQQADFALEKGAFFTLLGPSGCGKTTTLRCIAGLERPDHGTIRVGDDVMFDGESHTEVQVNLRQFGMVFQSYAIWPHMTVFENVAFPLRVAKDRRFVAAEITSMVERALDTVSLAGFGKRSATRLSGGQQQRVALARAIVRQPRLLLLDEPLSNLDAKLREEMRNELRRLQQQIGVTTVYVTHDQTEALELSDRIAVMRDGRIVQIGSPRDIYFSPCNAFVAQFVGSTNWLYGTLLEVMPGGLAKVGLRDGGEIVCLTQQTETARQDIRISVRPEAVSLAAPHCQPPPKTNRLHGKVVLAGFMGNITRFQIDVGGTLVQVYGDPTAAYAVGDEVAVDFLFSSARAFD
ncbi:MAG TPA: ABC transporter ATP-binding protein [Acetobacteraceae bacterium]|jgi:iron(III) transport system ATP-binding protein|nr:ABC transporter ATP-binding protein [Acetobacteraceae bacterium]